MHISYNSDIFAKRTIKDTDMSLPIKPTPTLSGEDMYDFYYHLYTDPKEPPEVREKIRMNAEEVKKRLKFNW